MNATFNVTANAAFNATERPPLLDVRGVHCVLGGQPILTDLNLQIEAGERVALIGPNGAGKSTLFQVISGLRPCAPGACGWRADGSTA
jgi:ABC-type cobalamin/Fe3+-siderophores transport systems, ATPase components